MPPSPPTGQTVECTVRQIFSDDADVNDRGQVQAGFSEQGISHPAKYPVFLLRISCTDLALGSAVRLHIQERALCSDTRYPYKAQISHRLRRDEQRKR